MTAQETEQPTAVPQLTIDLPEAIVILAQELGAGACGGDPYVLVDQGLEMLQSGGKAPLYLREESSVRLVADFIWRAYDNRIPSLQEVVDLRETVRLMVD